MTGRVYIIGAGVSGLSAALALTARGAAPVVCEAAGFAGGRCRSYADRILSRTVDNGTHLIAGANREVLSYLRSCSAQDSLLELTPRGLPFYDLSDEARWTLNVGAVAVLGGLWAGTGIPGVKVSALLTGLYRLSKGEGTVRQALMGHDLEDDDGALRRLWGPLCVAALNTSPERGAARLLWAVLRRTMLAGRGAASFFLPRGGLSETFVDPALTALERHGREVRYRARLRALSCVSKRVSALHFSHETVPLGPCDRVVLALPPFAVKRLIPKIAVPSGSCAIVNLHFEVSAGASSAEICAVLGGMGEWIVRREGMVSVTLSDAALWVGMSDSVLASRVWENVQRALRKRLPMGRYRIIREKRATFLQSPENMRLRPGPVTFLENLFLAGDWTDTGLPATIEGAVISGRRAARAVLRSSRP